MEEAAEVARSPILDAVTRATSGATLLALAIAITYVLLPLAVYLLGVEHEFFLQLAEVSALGAACIWLGSRLPFLDRLVVDDPAKRGVALDTRSWSWSGGPSLLFVLLVVATAERIPFLAALQGADPETVALLRERFLKAREGWQSVFVYVNALLGRDARALLARAHAPAPPPLALAGARVLPGLLPELRGEGVLPEGGDPRPLPGGAAARPHPPEAPHGARGGRAHARGRDGGGRVGTLRDEAAGGDFFTTGFAAQGPLAFVAWRAVAIPVLTAADALRVFQEEHGGRNLGGATSSMLAGLLGQERVNVERQVFAAQFGEAETGTGSANSVYVTEAFINFGWPGVVVFSLVVGLILRIFAVSRDEALRSLWMLFVFAVFVSALTGTLFSNGFLLVIGISLAVRFDGPEKDPA